MREEDLQLLITLDDPVETQEEDTFNHLQAENTIAYWFHRPFAEGRRDDDVSEDVNDHDD